MLHGEIKVNNIVIGEWKAVRKQQRAQEFNDYECFLYYRDVQGYPCEAHWTLHGHEYNGGAVGLAARVLSEGLSRAKRTRPTGVI